MTIKKRAVTLYDHELSQHKTDIVLPPGNYNVGSPFNLSGFYIDEVLDSTLLVELERLGVQIPFPSSGLLDGGYICTPEPPSETPWGVCFPSDNSRLCSYGGGGSTAVFPLVRKNNFELVVRVTDFATNTSYGGAFYFGVADTTGIPIFFAKVGKPGGSFNTYDFEVYEGQIISGEKVYENIHSYQLPSQFPSSTEEMWITLRVQNGYLMGKNSHENIWHRTIRPGIRTATPSSVFLQSCTTQTWFTCAFNALGVRYLP